MFQSLRKGSICIVGQVMGILLAALGNRPVWGENHACPVFVKAHLQGALLLSPPSIATWAFIVPKSWKANGPSLESFRQT